MELFEVPNFKTIIKDMSPRLIPDSVLSDGLNLLFADNYIRDRFGISEFSQSFDDPIKRIALFEFMYDDPKMIVFTTNDIFYLGDDSTFKIITRCYNTGTASSVGTAVTVTGGPVMDFAVFTGSNYVVSFDSDDPDECINGRESYDSGSVKVCEDGSFGDVIRTTRQWGTESNDGAGSLEIDSQGNIFMSSTEGTESFLTKLGSSGEEIWKKQWNANAGSIAIDKNDNIYLSDNNLLAKWSNSGEELWTRTLGTKRNYIRSIAIDKEDNIYVAGYTSGSLEGFTNEGASDIFIAKWNSEGEKLWEKQLGTLCSDQANSVAVDNNGNVYVTGVTNGPLNGVRQACYQYNNEDDEEYCNEGPSFGCQDIFLAKWNSEGQQQWLIQSGTEDHDESKSIAVDNNGNIFVTGTNLSFQYEGSWKKYLSKWNNDGEEQWVKNEDTNEYANSYSIDLDLSYDIYVVGSSGQNHGDIVIEKWGTSGEKIWSKAWGTQEYEVGSGVKVDKDGTIYVTGSTQGNLDGNENSGESDAFLSIIPSEQNK